MPERIDPFALTADLSQGLATALGKKLVIIRTDVNLIGDPRNPNDFDPATMRRLMKEFNLKAQEELP